MKRVSGSIRFIYGFTTIIYYVVIVFLLIDFIDALGLFFGFWGEDKIITLGIGLEADFKGIGEVTFMGTKTNTEFVNSCGSLRFVDAPLALVRFYTIKTLIFTPVAFWLYSAFYSIIRNVRKGKIFVIKNLYLLRTIGYVLTGFWMCKVLYKNMLAYLFFKDLHFEGIEFSSRDDQYLGMLLVGLFIWVLSHIFLKALELQEENELTI
jgi:hypothetical protein